MNKQELPTPLGPPPASRHGRTLLLSLGCASLAMIAAVWWYFNVQKQETEAATARELFAVSSSMSNQVANWRGERMGDGRVLRSSPAMEIAARLLSNPETEPDRDELIKLVNRMAHEFLYTGATLIALDGQKPIRLFGAPREGTRFPDLARAANQADDVMLSELFLSHAQHPVMELTIPVNHTGGLILDIDPERFLYPYLERWPGARRTAEAFLVRVEGNTFVYLSPRRHAPAITLFSRRPLPALPSEETLALGWSTVSID